MPAQVDIDRERLGKWRRENKTRQNFYRLPFHTRRPKLSQLGLTDSFVGQTRYGLTNMSALEDRNYLRNYRFCFKCDAAVSLAIDIYLGRHLC